MLTIEEKFYNHMGWKDNVEKNVFNLKFLWKYEFNDSSYDFIFGTFEIKWFFWMKKYFFVDWWDKQNHTNDLDDDLPIPTVKFDKDIFWEKELNETLEYLKSLGENIIPQLFKDIEKVKKVIDNEKLISFSRIKNSSLYSVKSSFNWPINWFTYNLPNVVIFFKETWEYKDFSIHSILQHYWK